MIISGKNLKLYCSNGNSTFDVLPEIEKAEYGYELQPGQKIYSIKYSGHYISHLSHTIREVSEISIITDDGIEYPWKMANMDLEVEPCENLYEKNKLRDILSGKIPNETSHSNMNFGKGIWYKHGGWRRGSSYEGNLKNFVKLGQSELF
jgi:hypothetical protein